MNETGIGGVFRVTISRQDKRNVIHAERLPGEGSAIKSLKIGGEEVKLDPFRFRVIEILISMLRDNRLRSYEEYQFLGENLYAVLFDNEIGKALTEVILHRSDSRDTYWRVELEFDREEKVLASWPWEYLYWPAHREGGGEYFLAAVTNLVLTRRLSLDETREFLPVQEAIRVLFVAASPKGLSKVEYKSIQEQLESFQKQYPGKIKVYSLVDPYAEDPLPEDYKVQATFRSFVNSVIQVNPHIIHFVGHGRCINPNLHSGVGQLAFMDINGVPNWVPDSALASKLVGGHLRLVFLQACESALSIYKDHSDPYNPATDYNPFEAISGVAIQLAQQNIPAVVAMQYRIQTRVATEFSQAFYEALIEKKSVEAAIQAGRLAILTEVSDWTQSSAFGLPVLYFRPPDPLFGTKARQATQMSDDYVNPDPVKVRVGPPLCPRCHTPFNPSQRYCGKCAYPLICPQCNEPVVEVNDYCTKCSYPLKPKRRGRPRTRPVLDPALPKRPRGRPRKVA